jgi:hypothetical protein
LFEQALSRGTAISPGDLRNPELRRVAIEGVVDYQTGRARREFESDPEFAMLADSLPAPAAVFAPYFYIEPADADTWLTLNLRLAQETAERFGDTIPVHAVLCVDAPFLNENAFLERLAAEVPATGVRGIWLWFSRLAEDDAPLSQLTAYRGLIESLGSALEVFTLHGGFFSLALSRVGLRGISHGVGYGEQKDVMPVIGQSTPTVRYYAPPLRRKLGVPEIERSFPKLGVRRPADFFDRVCDCSICRGVIDDDLRNFSQFGDMRYSSPDSRRKAQTPVAAKLCRFHFLLARFKEREWVGNASLGDIRARLEEAQAAWGTLPAIDPDDKAHVARWRAALDDGA